MHDGKIRRDGRVCVPEGFLDKVIESVHTYTHKGVSKTVEAFQRKYYTPLTQVTLRERAQKVVQGCGCATTKPGRAHIRTNKGFSPQLHTCLPVSPLISCNYHVIPATQFPGEKYDYLFW